MKNNNRTAINKQIKDRQVFMNDKIYRQSEKYFYSGIYYEMSLKMKMFKIMIEISKK